MDDSEWNIPVHREGKLTGLKKHRLLDGGEGKQKQSLRVFDEKGVRRGKN